MHVTSGGVSSVPGSFRAVSTSIDIINNQSILLCVTTSEVALTGWLAYVFVICHSFKRSADIFSSMAFPAPLSRQRWILNRIEKKSRHIGNWKALYTRRSWIQFSVLSDCPRTDWLPDRRT